MQNDILDFFPAHQLLTVNFPFCFVNQLYTLTNITKVMHVILRFINISITPNQQLNICRLEASQSI